MNCTPTEESLLGALLREDLKLVVFQKGITMYDPEKLYKVSGYLLEKLSGVAVYSLRFERPMTLMERHRFADLADLICKSALRRAEEEERKDKLNS